MLNPEFPLGDSAVDRLAKWAPLSNVAKAWQGAVVAALGKVDRRVTDALHGTPIDHALHPIVTDIPIGAWTVTTLLDVAELAGARDCAPGADAALKIGLAGAALAALSGWVDWSDTSDEPRTLGMAHAILNGAALGAYVTSLALRGSGRRTAGIAASMAGYALVSAGGYLGGELALGLQLGVKHTAAPIDPPRDWVAALAASAVADGTMKRVVVDGLPILLYRDGKNVSAVAAICTHRGAPLDEGECKDGRIECPWHGSVFSLENGGVEQGPATFALPRYETRTVDGTIEIRALV
jgi:nitrite reductase/ring-hydroxylating ferredoxin subunit/uncharacterized membrane protein